ncbi:hypothetical protein N7485_003565 [Penicillium canescens]|nr:hypothetical protein N7485_003565 [Penicillium canescens]
MNCGRFGKLVLSLLHTEVCRRSLDRGDAKVYKASASLGSNVSSKQSLTLLHSTSTLNILGKIVVEEASERAEADFYIAREDRVRYMRQILDINDERVSLFNTHGIGYTIVSLLVTGILSDKALAGNTPTEANNWTTDQIKKRPRRHGRVCRPSMHDPKQADQELRRCVQELGSDALRSQWLDLPLLRQARLRRVLERPHRARCQLVHPSRCSFGCHPGQADAALDLISNGVEPDAEDYHPLPGRAHFLRLLIYQPLVRRCHEAHC